MSIYKTSYQISPLEEFPSYVVKLTKGKGSIGFTSLIDTTALVRTALEKRGYSTKETAVLVSMKGFFDEKHVFVDVTVRHEGDQHPYQFDGILTLPTGELTINHEYKAQNYSTGAQRRYQPLGIIIPR
jgi:hypothetical protein